MYIMLNTVYTRMSLLQEEQNRLRPPQQKLENINKANTNLRLVVVARDRAI